MDAIDKTALSLAGITRSEKEYSMKSGYSACLGVVVSLLLAASSLAGEAGGRFTVDGARAGEIAPTHAAALEVRDSSNPRRKVIEIILSSAPIDTAAALEALHPHTHVINQPALMDNDYVLLWLAPDGSVTANATFGKTMTQYMEQSGAAVRATLESQTPERVAGSFVSQRPTRALSGENYAFDLRFDAKVARLPPGRTLKKGGEAPGKAFLAMLAVAKKKQWPALKTQLTPKVLGMFEASYRTPKENADYALDILKAWLPSGSLKITGGEVRDDIADLEIEGDMFPGTRALYLARMRQSGSAWLFDGATQVGMLR